MRANGELLMKSSEEFLTSPKEGGKLFTSNFISMSIDKLHEQLMHAVYRSTLVTQRTQFSIHAIS